MKQLSENWFVEPLFDYEYKTYEVLAYSNAVEALFGQQKFYPYLDRVQQHIEALEGYRKAKEGIETTLRSDLMEWDMQKLRLIRAALPDNAGVIAELDEIVRFAARAFAVLSAEGRRQLGELSSQVEITPLGIIAGLAEPGFLFFRHRRAVRAYTYHFRWVRRPTGVEAYKDVCTHYHSEFTTSEFENFTTVKWNLIKAQGHVKNSATNAYLVEARVPLPQFETLLPLARQYLINSAG